LNYITDYSTELLARTHSTPGGIECAQQRATSAVVAHLEIPARCLSTVRRNLAKAANAKRAVEG
jgi:hypothetical protein